MENKNLQIDEWAWGKEQILWGFDSTHAYTYKILEPRKGRQGCLSLQYHHEKSETWFVHSGIAWGLIVTYSDSNDSAIIRTVLLEPGMHMNLPTGIIHRLMGVVEGTQVLEASTPDRHAADKSIKKDVVRLHCVLGRECDLPRNELESKVVEAANRITEEAILAIESNKTPETIQIKIS